MTLQIEAGKYYRTRDGRKVGPMAVRWPYDPNGDVWGVTGFGRMWNNHGLEYDNRDGDIIAEWPAHIITHEGREYDLTALETPFGLLPEPVRDALQAWPHGVEVFSQRVGKYQWRETAMLWREALAHRAKPAPVKVRVHCQRGLSAFRSDMEFGTCIKRADGTIDWTTWEPQP